MELDKVMELLYAFFGTNFLYYVTSLQFHHGNSFLLSYTAAFDRKL